MLPRSLREVGHIDYETFLSHYPYASHVTKGDKITDNVGSLIMKKPTSFDPSHRILPGTELTNLREQLWREFRPPSSPDFSSLVVCKMVSTTLNGLMCVLTTHRIQSVSIPEYITVRGIQIGCETEPQRSWRLLYT